MELIADELGYKQLLGKLESLVLDAIAEIPGLSAWRGYVGPVPFVKTIGSHGRQKLLLGDNRKGKRQAENALAERGGISVGYGFGPWPLQDMFFIREGEWAMYCQVVPHTQEYVVIEGSDSAGERQVGGVLELHPFLYVLYRNENCLVSEEARRRTPNPLDRFKPPVLYVTSRAALPLKVISNLDAAITSSFGYGLSVQYKRDFQFPETVSTPPLDISGKIQFPMPASVIAVPLNRSLRLKEDEQIKQIEERRLAETRWAREWDHYPSHSFP